MGGDNGTLCGPGHHGPYCSLCHDDYFKSVGGACENCLTSGDVTSTHVIVLVIVFVVLLWSIYMFFKMRESMRERVMVALKVSC